MQKPRYKPFYSWDAVPLMMTTADVCNLLMVTDVTVGNLVKRGELKAVRVGNSNRFNKEDVRKFLKGA